MTGIHKKASPNGFELAFWEESKESVINQFPSCEP
jgi:hypothetical protein